MRSFQNVIDDAKGPTSGFDYLRIILATLVLFGHSFVVTTKHPNFEGIGGFLWSVRGHIVLPLFFALSGFLVAGSLVRVRRLPVFLGLRVLRLFPALATEVLLSALILGPLLTTVSLGTYVTSSEFWRYFINLVGIPQYLLPGVFLDNPYPRIVNGSLWTVPYEAECYILLAVLALTTLTQRPRAFLLAVVAMVAVMIVVNGLVMPPDLESRGTVTGRQLIFFFLAGVALFLARDKVPYSPWVMAGAVILTVLTVSSHRWVYVSVFPAAYMTAYLGLLRPKKLPLIFAGDYSYGIYLYAFPVQQTVQQLLNPSSPYTHFLISLLGTAIFAIFSWHVIEGPAQRFKKPLLAMGNGLPQLWPLGRLQRASE